ncbi:DUF4097 family beta strand repeat-containing protein [Actinoplanes sp. NPDC051494]|uniref:DUF4097 family beta strand repeat-containing protein n=1 Tax=Actinoplanes sp. NPDC051494 TaxID=3363907 RepID=UPI0037BBC0C5
MPVFESPAPIHAILELQVGDVRIAASDRTDTVVDVRPSNPGLERDVQAAEATVVEFSGDKLLVRAPRPRGLGVFGKPGSVDVEVALPSGSRLHATAALSAFHGTGTLGPVYIKTATGDVRLERTGTLEIHSSAGAVVVDHAAGETRITTATGATDVAVVDGNLVLKNSDGHSRVGRVTGNAKVSNANGDILLGSAGGDVSASTASGSIRVDEVSHGSVSVKTASGSLRVGVATGSAAYLDLNTTFGKVRSELAAGDAPGQDERRVEIKARTSFGDIDVVRAPVAA